MATRGGAGASSAPVQRRIEYTPLPSQARFHGCDARMKGFSGPVGSGKSEALGHEALHLALSNPGRTGLVGAPTYRMLQDATLLTLVGILEANSIPYRFSKSEFTIHLTDTGSRILLRSLDEHERLRGPNLAWFAVDELTYVPEESWLRLEARLRDPKAARLAAIAVWTPKGFDWVYSRFKAERVAGYDLIEARPFENRFVLQAVPDYYERLANSYDAAFYQQEALGAYVPQVAGRVYHAFQRSAHVRTCEVDAARLLFWSWDFNVNPMTSVIAQEVSGTLFVLDEIVLPTSSTPEVCDEFVSRYYSHPGGIRVVGDASGRQRQSTTGRSDFDLIREFFGRADTPSASVYENRTNPPVRDRVNATNRALMRPTGVTTLLISPRCKELIKDLEQVTYKPNTTQINKYSDPYRTHSSDALGYLVMHLDRVSSPSAPNSHFAW